MLRSVLFIDPPAFCTTVEGLVAPALRERPLIVAAPGADRATVLALSAEARIAGITRGMPVRQARKRCPDLLIRPPNPQLYARASRALHEILARYAPIIEPRGYGHAFLDLTGTGRLFGAAIDVAWRIQREAGDRLRLPLAVGIAQNKLVSEAASEVAKGWTAGQTVRRSDGQELLNVPPGSEERFLAPESVALLPDLDQRMRDRLDDYQLERIGEIQRIQPAELATVFGKAGWLLADQARGIDSRPVLPPAVKAEFRAVHTLADDTNDLRRLSPVLRQLTERLGSRLRARGLTAHRLTVHLAYTDYATSKRQVVVQPGALDCDLWEAARRAFALAQTRTVAVRALGVVVDRFLEAECQMDLFGVEAEAGARRGTAGDGREAMGDRRLSTAIPGHAAAHSQSPAQLQRAIDRIRSRWGKGGVRVGR